MYWLGLSDLLEPGDQPVGEYGRQTTSGGIENIEAGRTQSLSTAPSGFFPTPQRDRVISEMNAPAGADGDTYREPIQENQSMIQTDWWNNIGWVNTPYEQQFAIGPKRQESAAIAESVSSSMAQPGGPDLLADMLDTIKGGSQIGTVVNEFLNTWGIVDRPVVKGTPRAGYPAGTDDTHYNTWANMGADVVTVGKRIGGAFIDQVKGLFNLGYSGPSGSQPVFSIQHELEPGIKIGAVGIAAVIILVIFLMRRK